MNPSQRFGAYAALIAAGRSPTDLEKIATLVEHNPEYEHTVYRPALKIACALFDALGDASFEANVFRAAYAGTEKSANWTEVHTDLACEFLTSLPLEKKAGDGLLGSALDTTTAAAVTGGGTLGALAWLLNRQATADEPEEEKLRAIRDLYRDSAAEAKQRVNRMRNSFQDTHKALNHIQA